jgi:predicted ester cyclase
MEQDGFMEVAMHIDPNRFANDWIAAWNARDVETILSHYADSIVFLSPIAERVTGNGRIVGVETLRDYWQRALAGVPDLHFDLEAVLSGADSLTILYRNQRGQQVAEMVEFNAVGKVVRSVACYG